MPALRYVGPWVLIKSPLETPPFHLRLMSSTYTSPLSLLFSSCLFPSFHTSPPKKHPETPKRAPSCPQKFPKGWGQSWPPKRGPRLQSHALCAQSGAPIREVSPKYCCERKTLIGKIVRFMRGPCKVYERVYERKKMQWGL